jgi:malonyl-CoA/methylmalonyl-CoA synthetase
VPEASYFVETARAHGILANPTYLPLANEVAKNLGPMFKVVSSSQHCFSPIIDPRTIVFCASRMQDQRNPALVIFTSGSTGMPKGACYRRYNLYAHSVFIIKKNKIDGGYNNLQFMPTHHGTGLLVNTVPTILGGGCLEIMQGRFDGAKVWERLRKGDIRSFSAVPTMYVRLLDYWDNVISKLPATEREEYQKGISKIRDFHCSTSAIPRHVAERWPKVTGGAQVLERYSGTEFGSVFANYPGVKTTPVRTCSLHFHEGQLPKTVREVLT